MAKVDIYRDFYSAAEGNVQGDDLVRLLEELEAILIDPHASRARLLYLQSLKSLADESFEQDHRDPIRLAPNPFSPDEMKLLIEYGLLGAYQRGFVPVEKLFMLAHSIDGLEEFSWVLTEVPFEMRASCWTKSTYAPCETPSLVLDETLTRDEPDLQKKTPVEYLLYVDDVEAEAESVAEILRLKFGERYRVRGFTSPEEALRFVAKKKKAGQNTAMVVTDMYMPREYHGDELARKLHQVDESIPVIGYSGHNQYQNPSQAKKAGLIDLLSKQADSTTGLVEKVNSILLRKSA